MESARPRLHI